MNRYARAGWARFGPDPAVARWIAHALPAARAALADPARRGDLRCGGTWCAGVDALHNDGAGRVGGSGPLAGAAVAAALDSVGLADVEWHRGQVSVVYPGYPRRMAGEGDAAFRYRRDRDAAHLDGLLPVGPARRRMLREPHAFILGLPLNLTGAGASPLVVWEGSHEILRQRLAARLAPVPVADWPDTDLTEAYHAARREVFETCRRVTLHARPGEALLVHRLALHGIAPWAPGAEAPPEGRMIAYFRPEFPSGRTADWLGAP
jgi:hypothetical protein